MTLQQAISHWDGKSTADIEAIYLHHADTPTFVAQLLPLIATETTQIGATWLLKHHVEAEHAITQAEINEVYRCLPQQVSWAAKLHLLQCLPAWRMPETAVPTIHTFLHHCFKEKNKFVRAWAYNGFYELARQHPKYQAETRQLLTVAAAEEAAAIKARIRHIYKVDAASTHPFLTKSL